MAEEPIKQSLLNKAHKDKFVMVFTPPKSIREIDSKSDRDSSLVQSDSIQYSIWGAVIPTVRVNDLDAGYSGQSFKFSSHKRPVYDNILVNFTVDNRFNNYWILWNWINILNNNRRAIFKANKEPYNSPDEAAKVFEEYSTTITIFGLDEYDHRKIKFEFVGAIPVSLGQIAYNYRDATEVECTLEFAFSQLEVDLML